MKLFAFVGSAGLLLLLGAGGTAYAQDKPEEKPAEKPAEKPKAEPAKPHQQPETKPKENEPRDTPKHEEKKPEERKPDAQPAHQQPEHKEEVERSKTTTRTTTERTDQHNGNGGHRIPDDKYKAHFGQEHHFHVGHPRVEGGRSQFVYGGYNFYFVQPWPGGWGYDDDVYIVEIDGVYYLVNAVHPGAQLQLDIVL
jgi:hypothetical protein